MAKKTKNAFTTSDISRICSHSRETVKRWLERGQIKGYRVGTSGHWRVLSKDLALFLKNNNIPFPEPAEIGIDLEALSKTSSMTTFCWEFFKNEIENHIRPRTICDNCLVFKAKSINCYALRQEIGHENIYCRYSCHACAYFRFQQKEVFPNS